MKRRRSGFTLLEVLFAAGTVAMLMVGLYMSLGIAPCACDTANAAVAPVKTAIAAADLIRQDLESVLPPVPIESQKLSGQFICNSQNGYVLDFYCIGNDAGWAVAAPQPAQGLLRGQQQAQTSNDEPWSEGSRHVQILLKKDGNTATLLRGVTRNLLAPVQLDPEVEVLCRNVRNFTVQFYDGTTWQTEWDSTQLGDALPYAVQITLEVLVDSRPGQPPEPYTVTRVFPLACAKPATATGTGGTGTGGGAAGGGN